MRPSSDLLRLAREQSWKRFGRSVTFYLPGMFHLDGATGRYPALSITGARCSMGCDHCRGRILRTMLDLDEPERLVEKCLELDARGERGVLLSGGCDPEGRLPWGRFLKALEEVRLRTNLLLSVHCGLVDEPTARALRGVGVDQALIDVVGDDETYRDVCHSRGGVQRIRESMAALQAAGLPLVPHIVCGLNHGRIVGERLAIDMVAEFQVEQLVFVSLMPLSGTPMNRVRPPEAGVVATLIAEARLRLPEVRLSLGCARQRGNREMETLALRAGVNRMALPSDEALAEARALGLDIRFQDTCCSVSQDLSETSWPKAIKPGARRSREPEGAMA